jgi:8-hydroxy-5-deazaflavin:NADPH oxidoreductase
MKIGIIGSGGIGGTIGTHWAKAGHEILFSSRHPAKLADLVTTAGANARAGTITEAARFGDVLLYAGYYWTTDDAIAAMGAVDGKIVIDASNPYVLVDGGIQRVAGASAGRELAAKLPKARIVKAYNTLPTATFANEAHRTDLLALFLCGDDPVAKAAVAGLITDSGFAPVDTGDLTQVTKQEPDGPFYNRPMSASAATALVAASR